MAKQHNNEIRFTRREIVYSTYTSRITDEELARLTAAGSRDEQMEMLEDLGEGDCEHQMVSQGESIDSVEELTDLTDEYGENLLCAGTTEPTQAAVSIPSAVQSAFDEVRKFHPEVNFVTVTREGNWLFLNSETGNSPEFSSQLSTGVLDDMVDWLHSNVRLPACYQLDAD